SGEHRENLRRSFRRGEKMRKILPTSRGRVLRLTSLLVVAFAVSIWASVSGAIFTTSATGTTVNGNIYDAKANVYLTGGPQNQHDPGLVPPGDYYFQVTDPSGAVLLSTNPIACRQVTVHLHGRGIGVCGSRAHSNGTPNPTK